MNAPIFSSLVLDENDELVVASVDGLLKALNPQTGGELWSFNCHAPIFSTPLPLHQSIIFGCHDKRVYCLSSQGQLLWKTDLGAPIYSSPALVGVNICAITTTGKVTILDQKGKILNSLQLGGEVFSSPVLSPAGYVVFGCRDNYLYSFQTRW